MANTLLTISKITNEALMVLENELTFASEIDRNYEDQFAVVGGKIGSERKFIFQHHKCFVSNLTNR